MFILRFPTASTIKVCKRNDPQISDCVIDSIKQLQPRLITGDLGDGFIVPKLEPFEIKRFVSIFAIITFVLFSFVFQIYYFCSITIGRTKEFKASFKNVVVKGASGFKIDKLR